MKRDCVSLFVPIIMVMFLFSFAPLQSVFGQEKTPDKTAQTVENKGDTDKKEDETAVKSAEDVKEGEKSTEFDKAKEAETFSLWKLFRKGGPFMWPILLFAAVGVGFIVERFLHFKNAKLASREFVDQLEHSIASEDLSTVEQLCIESDNKIAKILAKGLTLKNLGYERVEKTLSVAGSVEVATLEKGLSILSALGNIVPMLGFLGTVSGMITAFSEIAKADQVKASLVAGGIQEALLTTAAGLIVAIPLLLFYNYFVNRIDNFIGDVERISSDVVERLIKNKETTGSGVI